MPISTSFYTELRFTISDYVQRHEWARLYEVCGTDDDEAARTIGVIMSGYEPKGVWRFVDYASNLALDQRVSKPKSVATVCYVLARMGQTNLKKTLSLLKQFLLENSELKEQVSLALSNMWVLSPREISSLLFTDWILDSQGSQSLQEAAVGSCEYLASKDPKKVGDYLEKISNLEGSKPAVKKARDLLRKYFKSPRKNKHDKKKSKKLKKKRKKKKHKGKKRKKKKKKK
jgi:hypothetical protein